MTDEHLSIETIERFFRSELSRDESRDFVRHLLRQCPECSRRLQAVAQRQDFQILVRGLEDSALRFDPDPCRMVLRRILRLVEQEEARAGPTEDAGGRQSRASLR
jgi:hypothetical protein